MDMQATAANDILYLNGVEVDQLCADVDTVQVVRAALELHAAGDAYVANEAYLSWVNGGGQRCRSLNMPGHLAGSFQIAGTKIINANPSNPDRGLVRASGVTLLFDEASAKIVGVFQAAAISAARTAAVTVLAAESLGVSPIRRVTIIGAGPIARAHLDLIARRCHALRSVTLFDLQPERARSLASQTLDRGLLRGVPIGIVDSPERAIRGAQLVIAATTATQGYIRYEWITPGSVLVNVSLDDLLPEVMLKADVLLVDSWDLVSSDSHRLLGKLFREGLIAGPAGQIPSHRGARKVDGELGDLLLGRLEGRHTESDIIVVNPFGMAIEDIAIATEVYRCALKRGIGTMLRA